MSTFRSTQRLCCRIVGVGIAAGSGERKSARLASMSPQCFPGRPFADPAWSGSVLCTVRGNKAWGVSANRVKPPIMATKLTYILSLPKAHFVQVVEQGTSSRFSMEPFMSESVSRKHLPPS